jgi:hypothetical protein
MIDWHMKYHEITVYVYIYNYIAVHDRS